MALKALSILYRGPLSSCNYGCSYCPFAKRAESRDERAADAQTLTRFETWVSEQREVAKLSILFTPWGEALHHRRYRDAIVRLSHLPHVERVAAQTNNAGHPGWLADANRHTVALWTTYHPSEVSRRSFLRRCEQLDQLGIRYSVGMVGRPDLIEEIEAMRRALAADTPMWVNAFSTSGGPVRPGTYTAAQIARLRAVDPVFEVGLLRLRTRGIPCGAGLASISVDGEGTVRRCHHTQEILGNLYQQPLDELLAERACPRSSCPCHIGYVHLPALGAERIYGSGLLERIPNGPEWADPTSYLRRAQALTGPLTT